MVGLAVLAAAASAAPDGSCKPKLLVTGISGYVASHVAKAALAAGYDVRGTVRSAKLNAPLAVALPEVEVVELDLLGASVEDVTRALDGCQYLAHVASPFPGATVDADQVTHPCTRTCTRTRATPTPTPTVQMRVAVEGTRTVMTAAKEAGVKRVVLTSSIAAIGMNHAADSGKGSAENPFRPDDWSVVPMCVRRCRAPLNVAQLPRRASQPPPRDAGPRR